MKYLMKAIVFVLVISVLTAAFCLNASALVIYEDDFGFEVNTSEHEAILVSYTGEGGVVQLPSTFHGYPVAVVDKSAFSGNTTIQEIVFSDNTTTLEEYAFRNCTSLQTVTIPQNVVNLGDRVFANCTSLQTVVMLSDITAMPSNIFSGCTSLSDLTINDAIVEFGYGCFNGCSSLTDLDFVSNGVLIQSYAFNGTGAESVVLSDLLPAVPNYAFRNCPNLRYVTIPASVVLIQPKAFDFDRITIRCYYGTYAYSYARNNGVLYELLDGVALGDANGDGYVNIKDVTSIQRYVAELEILEEIHLYVADVNSDEVVDINDASLMQMFLAEYDIQLPIGEIVNQ